MNDPWLNTLKTETPQQGYELAIMMSRKGVKAIQPDVEILKELRPVYASDANSLIASSQVIAINYQTIAQANDFWNTRNV